MVWAMGVRIGIGLFTGQLPATSSRTFAQEYRETIELVRLAERSGFASAWVSEHHGASDGYMPSLLVMLAAFAEATSTIELGTGVILTPLHDPIRLAEDASVVDQLSGGRLVVGLGLGWRQEEFRMLRIPQDEARSRHVETIEVLRRAWSGRRFSFDGHVFGFDQVRVTPPPFREGGPPIVLGGYVDAALRRAGALGDGHITDAADLDHVRHAVTSMDEGAREAGKDPARLRLILMQNAFAVEGGDAWSLVREGVGHQMGAYEAWDAGHDTAAHDSLEPFVSDESALRATTITGTAGDLTAALRPTVEAFGDRELELVLRLHSPGMGFEEAARAVELVGAAVIPALRAV
jgi:probable F420-dependent oxidoreductase